MSASPFNPKDIQRTTHELEQGNGQGLHSLLQGRTEQERLDAFNAIKNQNAIDRAGNANLPALSYESGTNVQGFDYEFVYAKGRQLFQSTLDIHTLTRTDSINGKDIAPPDAVLNTPADPKLVRDLTTLFEQGHGDAAKVKLASLPSEEQRIQAMQAVGTLNAEDVKSGATRASLAITISADKLGHNTISVQRGLPNFGDRFTGGPNVYYDEYTVASGQHDATSHEDSRPSP